MPKKKKADEQQQPRISPYTDSPVTLYVGPERKTYYVPKHLLLQNSGRITASLSQWSSSVYLPDIDTSTGHVLVHYLYTGAYQTLDSVETSPAKVHVEFKKAFVGYRAAKTYEISGLQQLAMNEIEKYGKTMTIFHVIEAINEDFSTLTGDTDWLQEYLVGKFSRAFEEDFTIFATSSFFDSISNADLYKFAVKCAVELYSNKISRLLCLEQREPVAFEATVGEGDLLEDRGAVAEGDGDGGNAGDEKKEEDDWGDGWGAAITKKKKGKKNKKNKEDEEEEKKRKEEEEEAEGKKKEEEKAERKKAEEEAVAAAATNTTNDLIWIDPTTMNNEDDWGAFAAAESKKKKGKKGKTAETAPAPPPAADPPTMFDMKSGDIGAATSGFSLGGWTSTWGSGTKGSASWEFDNDNKAGNKKDNDPWGPTDKKKGALIEPEPEPAPATPADDDWGAFAAVITGKKKKGAKEEPKVEELPPPLPKSEPEPELESVKELEPEPEPPKEEPVDPFKGLSKLQKKKLERKMKKEAEAKAKEEEAKRKEEEEAGRKKEKEEEAAEKARLEVEAVETARLEVEAAAEKARIEVEAAEKAKEETEAISGWASIWGSTKKENTKQRRERGKKEREEADAVCLAEEAEATCLAVETAAVEAPAATAAKPEPAKQSQMKNENFSRLVLELRKYIEADGVVCPDQAKHLLEERMWKSCRLCQGFLCQVANKIAFIIQPTSEVETGPVEKETNNLEAGRRI